jgi:MinD-like ATPase involved in chromosome partitioning or flagellar assembly
MSLVVVAGAKGAAGITTTATVLAAVWPTPAILADCDPSGGDVALRLRGVDGEWLARDLGVVGLAAAARTQPGALDVNAQLQIAVGGLPVLVGVESAEQSMRIGGLWPAIADVVARTLNMDVVADCGRLVPGLANEHLLRRADLLVLVARATVESVAHLRNVLDPLSGDGQVRAPIRVVVLAEPESIDRCIDDVAAAIGSCDRPRLSVSGLPLDRAAADALAGTPTRSLDRSSLVVAARELAADLYASLHTRIDTEAPVVDVRSAPVEVG